MILYPFTPNASKKLLSYFRVESEPSFKLLEEKIRPNLDEDPQPLFQKITSKEIEKLRKYA